MRDFYLPPFESAKSIRNQPKIGHFLWLEWREKHEDDEETDDDDEIDEESDSEETDSEETDSEETDENDCDCCNDRDDCKDDEQKTYCNSDEDIYFYGFVWLCMAGSQ